MILNKKYLFIRYSTFTQFNFKDHLEYSEKNGHFWFCKFGKLPSIETIKVCSDSTYTNLILHGLNGTFICKSSQFLNRLPDELLPWYYKSIDQKYSEKQKLYFKIVKHKKFSGNLSQYIVVHSGRSLPDVIKVSSNPIMIIQRSS